MFISYILPISSTTYDLLYAIAETGTTQNTCKKYILEVQNLGKANAFVLKNKQKQKYSVTH